MSVQFHECDKHNHVTIILIKIWNNVPSSKITSWCLFITLWIIKTNIFKLTSLFLFYNFWCVMHFIFLKKIYKNGPFFQQILSNSYVNPFLWFISDYIKDSSFFLMSWDLPVVMFSPLGAIETRHKPSVPMVIIKMTM